MENTAVVPTSSVADVPLQHLAEAFELSLALSHSRACSALAAHGVQQVVAAAPCFVAYKEVELSEPPQEHQDDVFEAQLDCLRFLRLLEQAGGWIFMALSLYEVSENILCALSVFPDEDEAPTWESAAVEHFRIPTVYVYGQDTRRLFVAVYGVED